MKKAFAGPLQAKVTIQHGEDSLEFILSAPPLGHRDLLRESMPPIPNEPPMVPALAANGKQRFDNGALAFEPAKKGSPEYAEYEASRQQIFRMYTYIHLGHALGDQLDTPFPAMDRSTNWAAYIEAIRAEFAAAGFVDSDVDALTHAYNAMLETADKPGKV